MDKQKQMLNAIELFHYARKYNSKRFVVYFEKNIQVNEFIFDFKLLNEAGVQFFIIMHEKEYQSIDRNDWQNYGIEIIKTKIDPQGNLDKQKFRQCSYILQITEKREKNTTLQFMITLAKKIVAQRIIMISHSGQFFYNDKKRHFVDHMELKAILQKQIHTNYSEYLLNCIGQVVLQEKIELTILKNNVGSIFEEIFTHKGSGTMFSVVPKITVRKAQEKDIMEIMILMKSYIEQGVILPVDRNELIKNIDQSYSFKIDDKIVAFAMFKHYQEGSEISRFCTLPRYRGKGLAKS